MDRAEKHASNGDGSLDLAAGERLLDRYVILDRVGSGGMASIWRAHDERLDRVVCVKLLRLVMEASNGASSAELYEATYTHFLQEAAALSKLQHPNTLRIYDFGYLADGRPFQISELLEGGNLETQVRAAGRFGEIETLGVLERICGAVAEAHDHGILHRDIKPSNILFARVARESARPGGHVLLPKLADFGIASSNVHRAADGSGAKSVSSVCLFSPRWAAPEQICGEPEGPTTDVYALGLVTAFMLGGRAPFADVDVRAHFDERIAGDAFAYARLDALGLHGAIRGVIARAMTADPHARTASPLAFFDEARAAFALTPHPPPPVHHRRPLESITLVIDESSAGARDDAMATPAERIATIGARAVRVVDVNEKLDFSAPLGPIDGNAPPPLLRFRATLLPSPHRGDHGFALHLKGLNCFVALAGARPTAAITATADGEATFVSGDREVIGAVRWSFGRPSDDIGASAGRAFDVTTGDTLVVPYAEASQAIAIDLGPDRELIVMGRRHTEHR